MAAEAAEGAAGEREAHWQGWPRIGHQGCTARRFHHRFVLQRALVPAVPGVHSEVLAVVHLGLEGQGLRGDLRLLGQGRVGLQGLLRGDALVGARLLGPNIEHQVVRDIQRAGHPLRCHAGQRPQPCEQGCAAVDHQRSDRSRDALAHEAGVGLGVGARRHPGGQDGRRLLRDTGCGRPEGLRGGHGAGCEQVLGRGEGSEWRGR
mmetsp:Transcript_66814/g.193030  ORF Transcript_66814/g.193030 Transcript_66814/m.193030 type:complete len:205 (+) Transcript_66814:493-1107(+)